MVVAVAAGQLKVTAGSAGVEVDRLWLHGGCGTAERQNRSIFDEFCKFRIGLRERSKTGVALPYDAPGSPEVHRGGGEEIKIEKDV